MYGIPIGYGTPIGYGILIGYGIPIGYGIAIVHILYIPLDSGGNIFNGLKSPDIPVLLWRGCARQTRDYRLWGI